MPDDAPDYDALRDQGRRDAREAAASRAPEGALERVAWARGWGQEDQLQAAVDGAREQGLSWAAIGNAIGVTRGTAESQYGRGRERQRAFRERKRQQEQEQEHET